MTIKQAFPVMDSPPEIAEGDGSWEPSPFIPDRDDRSKRPEWPDPVSAADLCANPPETPPVLIEGMLYQGGTMLISGPSKAKKTYSLLAAACAVADGRSWLGFKTEQCPVLHLNLELQAFATAKRLAQICEATGTKPPPDLHLLNLRGHHVGITELTANLPERIKSLGAGMVVVDPHYKVNSASGGEENSNDSQGQLLCALEGLCGMNGAALVVAHHFAKGDASAKFAIDRASGGGVFARWGDVMMTFTPHEEDEAMTVDLFLRNFAPISPFVVRWEHPVWTRDGSLDPAKLKQAGPKERFSTDEALRALGNDMMGYGEWMKAAGMSETTFRRKRDGLLRLGKVRQIGNQYQAIT